MKKIPTIFKRDSKTFRVIDEVNLECKWVFDGEGTATQKLDGTCCKLEDHKLFKRRGEGWEPVDPDNPADRWHCQAIIDTWLSDGTYELVGPKINGNPENAPEYILVSHDTTKKFPDAPRFFNELKEWLEPLDIEGLVWHHLDGRMAKIKKKDFGLKRKACIKEQ